MKFTFVFVITFLSISAYADSCFVSSRFKELESGINKKVICNETILSLTNSYEFDLDTRLLIEANDHRQKYSVKLTSIKLYQGSNLKYEGTGEVFWFPGDAYVELD